MITKEDINQIKESMGDMTKQFTEANYTISFINGQPGLVVRCDEPAELEGMVEAIKPYFKKFKEAVETKAVESGLTAKCKTCDAMMVKRSGTSASGKPWNALMCPNSKKGEPGHEPVWL
jgi:hypothetical protein